MDVSELLTIVGKDNFQDTPEVLDQYASDMSFVSPLRPRGKVKTKSFTEVQALIEWANKTLTPLIPLSSGAPHFRGDTVPTEPGALILDLSELNKIIRVDRQNRVCMIEPGVTFAELVPTLAEAGLKLNLPLLPRQNKSVIASMLEREPVLMPLYQWDALDPLTCIEVIFGNGKMFRTGSAAGPGSLEAQWAAGQAQVNPMGPGQIDLARVVQGSQGSMGVVTWTTVRCEALPTIQKPYLVSAERLEKLSDFIYRLMRLKIVDECLVLNNANIAAILAKDPEEYTQIRNLLPAWNLFFTLSGYEYFPEERVEYQQELMAQAAQQCGVKPVSGVSGITAGALLKKLTKPSEDPYWKIRFKAGSQDIFFITTLDKAQGFVDIMHNLAGQFGYPAVDMGMYIQPMIQGTSCHCEFTLSFDPENAAERKRVLDLYHAASERLLKAGAFYSRPYGAWADLAY
ncbi:MAG: FAD-binding protein, partial [Peptococcaceae bacterium]|nr:FAD-binding protein [Peptococcaceae bacterium]